METVIDFLKTVNQSEFESLQELEEYLKAYLIFVEWETSIPGESSYQIAIENEKNLAIKIDENTHTIYYQDQNQQWVKA